VDDMVRSLLRELEASGKLDNTFIFFTSDNGFEQGEHRIPKGKNRPYEESTRVPLFVRGPGVPAGSETEDLIVNTDFAPTFADLGGAAFSGDGRPFTPLLRGEDPPWRSAVLLERPSNEKQAFSAIRTENYKYVEYDNGEKELYDLRADPYELNSIPESANPSLFAELKTELGALKSCSGGGCWEAENLSPSPSPLPLLSSSGGPADNLASPDEGLPPGQPSRFYIVQPGNTLSEIARGFGASVESIAQANHIEDPNIILVGQTLVVPVVQPANLPTSGEMTASMPYTIKFGDTLGALASRFGTSVAAIAQVNGLDNPNLIFPGQKLKIPTS
jgi:LysM repeat protein